jgi:hypothetical protein
MCCRTGRTLPLRPKAVTPPLWNRAPRRERVRKRLGASYFTSPSFGNHPLHGGVIPNRTYSIARVGNTKTFLFKEPKLLVQTMDGGKNQIPSPRSAVIRAALRTSLTKWTIDRKRLKPDLHARVIFFKSGGFLRGRESEPMTRFISASAPLPLERPFLKWVAVPT